MSVLDSITRDLDWRETEIASMRLLLLSKSVTSSQSAVLLRAAWALLYAHYEGFCKNALNIFFDAAQGSGIKCADLPNPMKVLALNDAFVKLRNLPISVFLGEIESFSTSYLDQIPEFPEVDTRSNLWPSVLIELMKSADLSPAKVEEHQAKLSTLVARRNGIAHGENNIIPEFKYYKSYEDVVYEVIYDLAFQIEEKLQGVPFGAGIE
ncbi:MAE_28990/MAE_18760 family HEPN-like nuclease [Marilutibacter maris]|uniref:MAE_28990/MAE_18760 family HEPN-like nuclease n=1 Tax=Marilutibacter maris TaxID=1605891 RepID=UPI000DA7F7C0|nr:MAE_28990/MAE_18760 family HEPN-like nuclease [Lysobacter maris]